MGRPLLEFCIGGHGPLPERGSKGGCKQCSRERYQNWKDIHLKNRYGISQSQFDNMVYAQDGHCAICLQPETVWIKGVLPTLSVDHDHLTGQVRGLLCRRCNTVLGHLEDSIELLDRAKRYLEKNRT